MALFTLAVSAASSVNSPVLRWSALSSEDAQAPSPASAAVARLAARKVRLERSTGAAPLLDGARGVMTPLLCNARSLHPLAVLPVFHLPLGLILGDAIALLDLADQLVALAGHLVEFGVGQLAPL